jgi:hypothetical protein
MRAPSERGDILLTPTTKRVTKTKMVIALVKMIRSFPWVERAG